MVKGRNTTNNNITEDSMDDFGGDDPGSPYTSGTDRKRRRGVIEKRRRDRINCSLADLKRLVPDSNHKPVSN
ncbi:putative transcription factor hey (hesr1) [Schistosoma mansoni]|nr:putative transcription factor hey (hesr1) [Schistosoma mansoni]|eukprot:XP_018649396.1 putative transcription factor hey (hesr1) [Schistosoma mansoni]